MKYVTEKSIRFADAEAVEFTEFKVRDTDRDS